MATAIIWTLLPLGVARACATEGCETPASYEMDCGGVASNYCGNCRAKIMSKAAVLHEKPATETENS